MNFNDIDVLIFDFDGVMWKFKDNQEYFNEWIKSYVQVMQEYLEIESDEEAHKLNMELFLEYGSTYKGLCAYMTNKGKTLPSKYEFLGKSDKHLMASGVKIKRDNELVDLIRNVKGKKKYILSNNRAEYLEYGFNALGLNKNDFDGIICIEEDDYIKPEPEFYQKLIDVANLDNTHKAVFFDDKDTFLETAKSLSINTVWITDKEEDRDYVDLRTSSVKNILKTLV